MQIVKNKLVLAISSALLLSSSLAGTITGGNATSEADAKIVLDLVVGTDTSGSISVAELNAVSDALTQAIPNISCAEKTWVNSRTMGISNSIRAGTSFDESAYNVLDGANNTLIENSVEDLAPFSVDAISYYPWSTPQAGKNYFKAVLTIGDEGLEDGDSGTEQEEYDSGYVANQLAIAENTALFTLGIPPATLPYTFPAFQAMSEGTGASQLGGYTFGDTGGSFFEFNNDPATLQQAMEDMICKSIVTPGGGNSTRDPAKIPSTSFYSLLAMVLSLGFITTRLKRRK